MPAPAIFALARMIRCAIARSEIRNARATSAVVSPPSARRVSPTRASGASAGWQVVKIRRSRSSGIGLTSSASSSSSSSLPPSARSSASSATRAPRPALLAADPVERAVARRGDDPGRRVVRQPVARPALEGDQERVLHRLLGAIEVAEDAGEDGDRLSRLTPEQAVDEDVLGSGQEAALSAPAGWPSIAS